MRKIKSLSKFFNEEKETLEEDQSENSDIPGSKGKQLKSNSPINRLYPFLDDSGVLRVGGRVHRGNFHIKLKHPIIIPRKSNITNLLIRHYHERIRHQGRGMTTNEIRANGYWINGCSSAIYSQISKCVKCRRLRACTQVQRMSDLPADRLADEAPFTYSAVDFFGPWYIREGRKELKRYGVLFTCMACRAVHLETACSLDTSSFINSLRRFISIRGPIRQLRCDRGTNFVGAENELRDAVKELDDQELQRYLTSEGCDFITFKMNVPSASHMGGVWERQIGSVRNVLSSLMEHCGSHLDDEMLRTFMCEAAAIVYSRPLTAANIHDPNSLEPLTPNHLLIMKSNIILPPPGQFQREDFYSRKRWRRVQYLTNEFWIRWRKEFLNTLQTRGKWTSSKRDMSVGDVVLIKDENLPRNQWRLGRIHECYTDHDGHVRKVKLVIASSSLDKYGKRQDPVTYLERPIHKLVLLHETEEFPTEESN